MKSIRMLAACFMLCTGAFAQSNQLSNGSLPSNDASVKFYQFDASIANNAVTCKWTTEEKSSNNYFELERSADGINFKTAAIIFTAENNTGSKQEYMFKDKLAAVKAGSVYYRIRQIDKDGGSSLSKTISVQLKEAGTTK